MERLNAEKTAKGNESASKRLRGERLSQSLRASARESAAKPNESPKRPRDPRDLVEKLRRENFAAQKAISKKRKGGRNGNTRYAANQDMRHLGDSLLDLGPPKRGSQQTVATVQRPARGSVGISGAVGSAEQPLSASNDDHARVHRPFTSKYDTPAPGEPAPPSVACSGNPAAYTQRTV
jgi:hypothetical protein